MYDQIYECGRDERSKYVRIVADLPGSRERGFKRDTAKGVARYGQRGAAAPPRPKTKVLPNRK